VDIHPQQNTANNTSRLGTAFWAAVFAAASLSAAAPAQTAQPGSTLRVAARRVSVDVVVTDSKGRPVRGLTRDDFKVFEDGVQQTMRSFDAHAINRKATTVAPPKLDLPPNTYSNLVQAPEDGPVTVLLYDVLNTPSQVMPYAHDAMVKFIKNQPPGSRTAIFILSDRLRMLEGFTDDDTRLLAAINSKAAKTQQSTLLLNSTTSGNSLPDLSAGQPTDPNADPTAVGPSTLIGQLSNLETMEQVMQYRERIFATAEAFAEIARYLSSLPGRKNMMWLSGSFPGSVLPNTDLSVSGTSDEFGMTINADREIKIANDLLNAAHVSVYPIDVRGLQVDTFYSASVNPKTSSNSPPRLNSFGTQQNAEHSTMDTIADNTGGHAFYNTNGLGQAMEQAMDQGSVYYTLTYTPSNPKFDGGVRHIKVQLDKDGYNLSYRKTYYAENANLEAGTPGKTNTPIPEGTQAYDPMTALMKHGAPISSELFFESSVLPVEGVMPATAKEAAQLAQFSAKRSAKDADKPVMVQHYEVSLFLLGRLLEMPALSNGKYDLKLGFGVAAFDADGLLQNGIEIQYNDPIAIAEHDRILSSAYRTKLDIALPLDARWIRIAVRDANSGHTGTIEVPVPAAMAAKH
jgi:VWFA-related protein